MSDWQFTSGSRRQRANPPPLDVWVRTVMFVFAVVFGSYAYLRDAGFPLPTDTDREHFASEIESLALRVEAARKSGENPASIVFIGTSRIKNVTLNRERVSRAARDVAFGRPVISMLLAINWGGFERLEDAVRKVASLRPDYVVFMPEMLREDIHLLRRIKIIMRYLRQRLRGQEHKPFDNENEFTKPACSGFDEDVMERVEDDVAWMTAKPASKGPKAAAAAIRNLTAAGSKVYVVAVPRHPELRRVNRKDVDLDKLLATHKLDEVTNVSRQATPIEIPVDAYCDFAHIDPRNAGLWLSQVFNQIAKSER